MWWLSTPSAESITRPRLAVAVVSAFAAASLGYYAWQTNRSLTDAPLRTSAGGSGGGLQRSNAVRRLRRLREDLASSSDSEGPGDENADMGELYGSGDPGDGDTVVDGGADDWWNDPGGFPVAQRAGHNIVNLLFRVSEDNARRNGCVHRGCQCNSCGMVPIRGVRYRCANCADFDLCETCEALGVHVKTHVFYKIKVPAPPFAPRQTQSVWYTGDPDTSRRNLPRALIPKLTRASGFERPELEAFWEQWTFMANTEWRDDPDDLGLAMDRKTFERCLVPTGGLRHAAPNLIHDRMFSFYDSNGDELIDFNEFLQGLSFRKRKDKLRKVFEGYDIDGDGYVDRRDFLRMFRAYYVLYKQMHKDILDGLEDQLLSSTEAQQLVASRQPLSSLFGREGRVPSGDASLRLDGKTYHQDGSVEIEDAHRPAVVDDRGDTTSREEVLTSLFAYESDPRRFVTGAEGDNHWRIVRRTSANDRNRAYWVTLLDVPTDLGSLPPIILGQRDLQAEEGEEVEEREEREEDEEGEEDTSAEEDNEEDLQVTRHHDGDEFRSAVPTESLARARVIAHNRQQVPKLEKRRRDMARAQLHDRWKRRQFYLDEEEGGVAPDDWDDDEDVLANLRDVAESSKAAEQAPPLSTRSRSSSKVRFAEDVDLDDVESQSNRSASSRSIPERWGGMDMPYAEKDAGKEILYQVTQQAFNELLDTLFKPSEELAIQAAETRADRDKYKDLLASIELVGSNKTEDDKSLEQLLAVTGYTVVDEPHKRLGVGEEKLDDIDKDLLFGEDPEDIRDPTMPQFRPNSDSTPQPGPPYPIPNIATVVGDAKEENVEPPTQDVLQFWKRIELAEAQATKRGGWGKLNYEEFEAIYKSQEDQGNRLDYLGSWIDFCIP